MSTMFGCHPLPLPSPASPNYSNRRPSPTPDVVDDGAREEEGLLADNANLGGERDGGTALEGTGGQYISVA